MSVVVSVLTPKYLVHVSDAAGPLRTVALRYPNARGLLTLAGAPEQVAWMQEAAGRTFADPEALAAHLAERADVDLADADELSMAYAGWGYASDGREISFRYLVSNFESGEAGFVATGETMVPTPARPGGRGAAPKTSFSVVASATTELSAAARRAIEELPRKIKKAAAMDVALAAAAIVRDGAETPVLVAHLTPDGALEAAILDGDRVRAVTATAETGTAALVAG